MLPLYNNGIIMSIFFANVLNIYRSALRSYNSKKGQALRRFGIPGITGL